MQTIPRDESLEYLFDYRVSPKLRVALGESFAMQTWDASAGEVRSEADADRLDALSIRKFHPPKANPISGPVYVEGVAPGDTLVVTIERVEVAGPGGDLASARPGSAGRLQEVAGGQRRGIRARDQTSAGAEWDDA